MGTLRARAPEWVTMLSGDLPNPGTEPASPAAPALTGVFFTTGVNWEAAF